MANATQSDVLGKFVWYDQMSNDLPGAEKFYSKVVGWSLAPNTMNAQKYTLLKAGETMVGGLMPIPDDAAKMGARPAWMGYIAVDDVKAYVDKVKAAGGAIYRPPTEIPNVGTFAVAGDPSGAGFLLFKGSEGGEAPKHDPTKPGNIGWHELHGGDPEKSWAFYSGLFGWTKGDALDMGPVGTYQIFMTKGQQSGGMMKKMDQEPVAHWLYYITVDAIDAALDRVKSAGGQVVHGPVQVPGGSWIINGIDTQGAVFALVAPKR
jgi:predicted enzyme related to lactoylglutathione lyase